MPNTLQQLIDEGKLKEALDLFKDNLAKETVDSGQLTANLLEAYIDSINAINMEENSRLEDIQEILGDIQKIKNTILKEDTLNKIKSLS